MSIRTLVVLSSLATAAVATAQEAPTSRSTTSVRVGAFFPSDALGRREAETWLTAGVEYRLPTLFRGSLVREYEGTVSVSADYIGSGDLRSIPLLVNYVGRFRQISYSAGAGIAFNDTVRRGNRTDFAWQLGLAFDLTNRPDQTPLFLEVKYFGSDQREFRGVGAFVGVRF